MNIVNSDGSVNISNNKSLASLKGMDSLSTLKELYVRDNPSLTNINELSTITFVRDLFINDNDSLSNFCGLYPILNEGRLGWKFHVTGNLLNPTRQQIIDNGPCITTDISENRKTIPLSFELHQNYPNPFNPTTTINYSLPQNGHTTLKIFDILGRNVSTLVNQQQTMGTYSIEFDRTNLPSGIYFYQLKINDYSQIKKMILLK